LTRVGDPSWPTAPAVRHAREEFHGCRRCLRQWPHQGLGVERHLRRNERTAATVGSGQSEARSVLPSAHELIKTIHHLGMGASSTPAAAGRSRPHHQPAGKIAGRGSVVAAWSSKTQRLVSWRSVMAEAKRLQIPPGSGRPLKIPEGPPQGAVNHWGKRTPRRIRPFLGSPAEADQVEEALAGEGSGKKDPFPPTQPMLAATQARLWTDYSISLCFGEAPALCASALVLFFGIAAAISSLDRFNCQHSAVRVVASSSWRLPWPDREAQAVKFLLCCRRALVLLGDDPAQATICAA